jgi:hypothetical protein
MMRKRRAVRSDAAQLAVEISLIGPEHVKAPAQSPLLLCAIQPVRVSRRTEPRDEPGVHPVAIKLDLVTRISLR